MFAQDLERRYREKSLVMNAKLRETAARKGLGAALRALHVEQVLATVADSSLAERCAIGRFMAIVRPARAMRHHGAGLNHPPGNVIGVNQACHLDLVNIMHRSLGQQIGFEIRLGRRMYAALCQPFPIEMRHFTFALMAHATHAPMGTDAEVRESLDELLQLAIQLPSWVVFLNGRDAGASIRAHHHFQGFQRPSATFQYPLEVAADVAFGRDEENRARGARTATVGPDLYPLTALVAEGPLTFVLQQLVEWAGAWRVFNKADEACGNWIAVGDPDGGGRVRAYFALRSPLFANAPGFVGKVASVETLGQIVVSTDEWRSRLERGEVTEALVHQILKAVDPPGAGVFVNEHLSTTSTELVTSPDGKTREESCSTNLVALIALGGYGTRAGHSPKALQLIWNKPLYYYLVSQAMQCGARRLVIAVSPEVRPFIQNCLGEGESIGLRLQYVEIDEPRGPADLFLRPSLAPLIAGNRVVMILDGVYLGSSWGDVFRRLGATRSGCSLLSRFVEDPRPFGFIHLAADGSVAGLTEKRRDIQPRAGVTFPVVTHMCVFDDTVLSKAANLKRGANDEFQLTDLQSAYAEAQKCVMVDASEGVWMDAGTPKGVAQLCRVVEALEDGEDGRPAGSPHWTAYELGLITEDQLRKYTEAQPAGCPYRASLLAALEFTRGGQPLGLSVRAGSDRTLSL